MVFFWKEFSLLIKSSLNSLRSQPEVEASQNEVETSRSKSTKLDEKKIEEAKVQIANLADEFLSESVRDAILIHRSFPTSNEQLGHSKLGGLPDLPEEYAWPIAKRMIYWSGEREELPMHFLAQIECSEVPDSDLDLPKKGTLFFFGLVDECSDWDQENEGQLATVIYVADMPADRKSRNPPSGIVNIRELKDSDYNYPGLPTLDTDLTKYPAWPITFIPTKSYPQAEQVEDLITIAQSEKYGLDYVTDDFIKYWFDVERSRRQKLAIDVSITPHLRQSRRTTKNLVRGWREIIIADQNYPQIGAQIHDFARVLGQISVLELERNRKPSEAESIKLQIDQAYTWLDRFNGSRLLEEVQKEERAEFQIWFKEILKRHTLQNGDLAYPYTWSFPKALRLSIQRAASQPTLWQFISSEYLDHMWEDHEPCFDDYHEAIGEYFHHKLHQIGGYFQSSQMTRSDKDPMVPLLHLNSDNGIGFLFADVGEAQFFIKHADSKEQNFDNVSAVLCGT